MNALRAFAFLCVRKYARRAAAIFFRYALRARAAFAFWLAEQLAASGVAIA